MHSREYKRQEPSVRYSSAGDPSQGIRQRFPGGFLVYIIVAIVLSSCARSPVGTGQAKATATLDLSKPTSKIPATIAPETATPSSTPQPTPTVKQTPIGACTQDKGSIETFEIDDARLPRPMPVRIYLPPCYQADADAGYPALYLLHGLQSTDSQWIDLGIGKAADRMIVDSGAQPFIIVMPWHRTGIDLISAVPEVLVPYVEANYSARSDRKFRAIGGLSKGGGQALVIGLMSPDVFSAVGMHSPAIPYEDSVILTWATRIPPDSLPAFWIDIGRDDSLYPAAKVLIEGFETFNIPINVLLEEGDHLPGYWRSHTDDYLHWYSSTWTRYVSEHRTD